MFKFLGITCFLLFLTTLIISINPKWIARGKEPMKRSRVLMGSLVMFALFVTFANLDSDDTTTPSTPTTATAPAPAPEPEVIKLSDSDKTLLIKNQYKLFSEDEIKQFAEIEKKFNDLPEGDKTAAKADFDRLSEQKKYQEWIKSQFSAWDGSHRALVDLVEKHLNDPDSFEHEETTYKDMKDHLIIKMRYRAKNGFGALILQNVTAKADYKTGTIEITSQND